VSRIRRPSPALVVATAALVVALGGVTYAAIPSSDGTIHSCYDARGSLHVIDEGTSCPSGNTALNFSQTGPQGPRGADGAQGPAGAPGQTRLLNFTRTKGVEIARKAGAPIGTFDLPEGTWQVMFTGGVRIPNSKAVKIPTDQKVRASSLNFTRNARAFSSGGDVTCKIALADGSVRQTVGNGGIIGVLLPAVQTQHSGGGGGGAGKGQDRAAIYMQLLAHVPAGGARGFLACNQAKDAAGFTSPNAVLHDISIHAGEVQDAASLNFTFGQ
jgi:hypothetical protein